MLSDSNNPNTCIKYILYIKNAAAAFKILLNTFEEYILKPSIFN